MKDILQAIIDSELYTFENSFTDWRDALKAAADPLLAKGIIEEVYISDLISAVEQHGPYIVIVPDKVAMPHSTLGNSGVNETAIGFMRCEEPVVFPDGEEEKSARIFFTLAAVDYDKHLENMQALAEMLLIEGLIDDLIECKDVEELQQVHDSYF